MNPRFISDVLLLFEVSPNAAMQNQTAAPLELNEGFDADMLHFRWTKMMSRATKHGEAWSARPVA